MATRRQTTSSLRTTCKRIAVLHGHTRTLPSLGARPLGIAYLHNSPNPPPPPHQSLDRIQHQTTSPGFQFLTSPVSATNPITTRPHPRLSPSPIVAATSTSTSSSAFSIIGGSSRNKIISRYSSSTAQMQGKSPVRKVTILGTGPSGLTAALYTARANLQPLVLHGATPGGQLTTTTEVENYPGFIEGIDGNALIDNMTKQAERFGAKYQYGTVAKVVPGTPIQLHLDGETEPLETNALIVATGARPRKLGIPSEDTWWSKGVTSCATCDGFFYKGKEVCVIGGGDSAMEEANFLTRFCPKVHIIHRRDSFRASKIMADRVLKNPKINVIWNSAVEEILGDESRAGGLKVVGVRLKDIVTSAETTLAIEGVFLAIGHIPNTDFLKGVVDLDAEGYALTKPNSTKTNVDGIFVSGDAQDHVFRQAITAAGSGCMAAIEAERWLEARGL